jgi:serine/threonine protein kinase
MSADVWSVGVMLYQMMAGKFPFWDIDTPYIRAIPVEQVFDDIMHAPVLPCDMIREDAADLLARMLDRDVSQRITAEQAMQHPWFQRVLGSAAGAQ